MNIVNAKSFTCASCQKMITYGPDQAGAEVACPRCGAKSLLPPQAPAPGAPYPLRARRKKKSRLASCLLMGCGGCLGAALLLALAAALGVFGLCSSPQLPARLRELLSPLLDQALKATAVTAPEPASNALSQVSVTVTRMAKECPLVYQASLRQSSATETPVYCVTVKVTNGGGAPVQYRSWRELADDGDVRRAATLLDGGGGLLGLVSFGPGSWPLGAQRHAEIPPESSVTDILLFQCGEGAEGDFLLTLPGANVGRSGELRFRIPREMVR